MISIVIPTFNEPNCNDLFNSLEKQTDKDFEIIIANASKNTPQYPQINQSVSVVQSSRGRGLQLNYGAKQSAGDILWFLHADSKVLPSAIATIKKNLSQTVNAGAFTLCFDSRSLYFKVISTCGTLRSKLTRIPFGDQGIFIKKTLFNSLGMFPEQPLMEDIALMKKIRKNKKKVIILNEKLFTSTRRYIDKGQLKTTILNTWYQCLYSFGMSAEKIAKKYYA
ncbi:hypothetical protein DID80_03505 [Candidatus Marinamargulisbacteria bacterium SCGC AAA071-K20]|nr:hypothetical protein DID80_03505 [Candidatus Marinamargulisbacteria bacterium SCGC AAA071-K20]